MPTGGLRPASDLASGSRLRHCRQDAGDRVAFRECARSAVALLTKAVFDRTLGIRPTAAEEFVTMRDVLRIA